MEGVTTSYTLDLNNGLTQVLTDGSGAPIMAQSYAPYGDVTMSAGETASNYGFAGEWTDGTGLQYLRARYLNTGIGRFISRDTWGGDYAEPISQNRWLYGLANPIMYIDPTGNIACTDTKDPECVNRINTLRSYGSMIKESVYLGSMLPVEGLALFVDYAFPLFDDDLRGAMWAITLTITGFDANRGMIGPQAPMKQQNDVYWFDYDWLPYQNNRLHNEEGWGLKGEDWIHSRRGDWDTDYWDKTANQAYHFWFYVAVVFFDGLWFAEKGNRWHEGGTGNLVDITALDLGDGDAPPAGGNTLQDENLSQKAFTLGSKLSDDRFAVEIASKCPEDYPEYVNHEYTDPGAWIRTNLKGP